MNFLIQQVEIIDIHSHYNRQKVNILIENGYITQIVPFKDSLKTPSETSIIQAEGFKISIGWMDMRAHFQDPGFEHKETLASGCEAAMFGGFTEVALLPNTHPVVQSKNEITYILHFSKNHLVNLHPIGAVTVDTLGNELTEMIDLHTAGAVAFSDGEKTIWNSDILQKTLLYLQKFEGVLLNRPEDMLLAKYGVMNEGIQSTLLGLKGIPHLSEELIIQRDLALLEYTGGKIHFSLVSSAKSIELIRKAKQKGLNVTCDIAAHQIAFDDTAMVDFDTNKKVNPPFRNKEDIEAIWEGLEDDTIDVIVSNHSPQDEESKNLEFDLAEFGMIGLETLFPIMNTYNKEWEKEHFLPLDQLIEKITYRPRQILLLPIPKIQIGEEANLTLFDTEKEWIFAEKHINSLSKNTPFLGHNFKGKALALWNKRKFKEVKN